MRLRSSLRWRLIAILIALFGATWLAAFGVTYSAAAGRIGTMFDAQLSHDAGALLVLAEQELGAPRRGEGARVIPVESQKFRKLLAFAVWHGDRLALRSDNEPEISRPETAGYADLELDGRPWRGFTLIRPQQGLTIWVGEPFSLRGRMIGEITRDVLFPMLLALPLLAAAVGWGVTRGLAPLARVTSEVAERSPSNMQPVGATAVPDEVKPLVGKLDDLLSRLRTAFDLERRFTADAAHEIRTPLATIRTHAQVAMRAPEDAQRRQSLEQVIDGVDRTTRLATQLLTLARLDREALEGQFAAVDLGELAAEVLASLQREADAKQTMLSLAADEDAAVRGNRVALGAMLRNLVENAIRYGPPGGSVDVSVQNREGRVALIVTDDGPGIAVAERERVFDRFYRGAHTDSFGCGLGLSIARRVAELHGTRIVLAEGPSNRGLRATVSLSPLAR